MAFIVAIDGPASSGKGAITEIIAKKLNLKKIDTGIMYRCITLEAIEHNLTEKDQKEILELLNKTDIVMNENKVLLNGNDVTEKIRTKEVNELVSQISAIKELRYKMVEWQRKMAEGKDIIMEGRDIGTVVFPDANVKIYLDADVEVRAIRRYKQNLEKNINTCFEEVLENIRKRDKIDKEKEYGALKIADDAIVVDTTNLDIEQTVKKVLEIIMNKQGE